MQASLKAIELLQQRLKNIGSSKDSYELQSIARAISSISRVETTDDILNLSNKKLNELFKKANNKIAEIEAFGDLKRDELLTQKGNFQEEIKLYKVDKLNELTNLLSQIVQEINTTVEDFGSMNDVSKHSTITAEIARHSETYNFLKPFDLPFLFGIFSRSNDNYGVGGFTTALGTLNNSGADHMLSLLAGCHEYTTENAGVYLESRLCFLQGRHGNFNKKKSYIKYKYNTSQYKYPYAALGCLFVKNRTNEDISSTINFGGSSYSSTGGAGMFVGVPDHANKLITWVNVYSYSSSSADISNSASITIPANSTVCILLYTSSYYMGAPSDSSSNSYYYYAQFIHWRLSNIRSGFLINGLDIDQNITLKSWQCRGFSNIYDLWRGQ